MADSSKHSGGEQSKDTKSVTSWDPEYWGIIAEIDASYYVLAQMQKRFSGRDPITQMVDAATGYDRDQLKEAKKIVDRIKVLQAKLPPDDPHFVSQDEVNDLEPSDYTPPQTPLIRNNKATSQIRKEHE